MFVFHEKEREQQPIEPYVERKKRDHHSGGWSDKNKPYTIPHSVPPLMVCCCKPDIAPDPPSPTFPSYPAEMKAKRIVFKGLHQHLFTRLMRDLEEKALVSWSPLAANRVNSAGGDFHAELLPTEHFPVYPIPYRKLLLRTFKGRKIAYRGFLRQKFANGISPMEIPLQDFPHTGYLPTEFSPPLWLEFSPPDFTPPFQTEIPPPDIPPAGYSPSIFNIFLLQCLIFLVLD